MKSELKMKREDRKTQREKREISPACPCTIRMSKIATLLRNFYNFLRFQRSLEENVFLIVKIKISISMKWKLDENRREF